LPFELPVWWALSAGDFAQAIGQGQVDPDDIKWILNMPQDLAPMRRTWTEAEQQALIRCGHPRLPDLSSPAWAGLSLAELARAARNEVSVVLGPLTHRVESLPDAAPWLALMASAGSPQEAKELRDAVKLGMNVHWRDRTDGTWARWIASSYGAPGWEHVESMALEGSLPVREAFDMFRAGRQPIDPEAFRKVVARSLHQGHYLPGRPLIYIKRWLEHDPQAAQALVLHGPAMWVERLVSNTSTPLAAIDALLASDSLPPALQRRAWRNRLSRTGAAPELVRLSAQMPKRPGSVAGLSHWLSRPEGPEQNHAQVLVRRRDGHHLMDLGEKLSEPDFSTACLKAAQVLRSQADAQDPAPSRLRIEAAGLELLAHLGAAAAPALVQSLNLRHSANAAGCKFDWAYSEYRIPKKNGGERLICAPHRSLRKLQAMVLQKLLVPLAVHPAACGFVPGRSVVDNARPHVGQAVVVNADIRNCFPSVRWPLVLGVLRRELGGKLSPAAISLLLDLCTARGVLPVGAPTSPALLNLVLRRTDEVLQQAADHAKVRYTRYADDLTFSGGRQAVGLLRLAERTLAQIGLELDPLKTNIFRRGRRQMVTGLVVNQQVSVPRSARRRLRAAVHHAETGGPLHWNGQPEGLDALRGRLAFVRMVDAAQAQPLVDRLRRLCTEKVSIGGNPDPDRRLPGAQP
jgi:retron-type reverse transcriptase